MNSESFIIALSSHLAASKTFCWYQYTLNSSEMVEKMNKCTFWLIFKINPVSNPGHPGQSLNKKPGKITIPSGRVLNSVYVTMTLCSNCFKCLPVFLLHTDVTYRVLSYGVSKWYWRIYERTDWLTYKAISIGFQNLWCRAKLNWIRKKYLSGRSYRKIWTKSRFSWLQFLKYMYQSKSKKYRGIFEEQSPEK